MTWRSAGPGRLSITYCKCSIRQPELQQVHSLSQAITCGRCVIRPALYTVKGSTSVHVNNYTILAPAHAKYTTVTMR